MARTSSHPGNIQKRGNTYRLRLDVGGKTHSFTLRGMRIERVREIARAKHAELVEKAQRVKMGLPASVTFTELLHRYGEEILPTLSRGTQGAYHDSLKPIRTYFVSELGDPVIDTVRATHVRGFLSWRRTHGPSGTPRPPVSNRTLAKDRAVLHRLFSFADSLELRDGNPVARVGAPKSDGRDPVILSDAEYERFLEACRKRHPMLGLYVLLLGETGTRAHSEALHIQWQDIDLAEGFLWIDSSRDGHRTKSGKGRWIPMTARLKTAIQKHLQQFRFTEHGSPWVFHHLANRRRGATKAGDRVKNFRVRLKKSAVEAKLPEGFHLHDLRHRRVTTWLADGKNPVHVKEALGHADLRTTMGYTHLAREHLRILVKAPDARPGMGSTG